MNICGNDLAPLCANNARLRVKSSVVMEHLQGFVDNWRASSDNFCQRKQERSIRVRSDK